MALIEIKKWFGISAIASLLIASHASALDINGNGDRTGVVALYTFSEGAGATVADSSGVGTPLNLVIDRTGPSDILWGNGSLTILLENLVASPGPATKIIDQCGTTDEITIEAWVAPQKASGDQEERVSPVRIVNIGQRANNTAAFLGQSYDGQQFFHANTRSGNNANIDGDDADGDGQIDEDPVPGIRVAEGVVKKNTIQHIFFTKDAQGVARIFASDAPGEPPVLRTISNDFGQSLDFDANYRLSLANVTSYGEARVAGNFLDPNDGTFKPDLTTQNRGWRGTFHMVAIYCNALDNQRILGARAPRNWLVPSTFPVDLNDNITPNRVLAQLIYRRLVGNTTPLSNPVLIQMESDLNAGTPEGRRLAASRVTDVPGFYMRTVSDMARRMSVRDEVVNGTRLNDLVAGFVGITRDERDARELLNANYTYVGDPQLTAVPNEVINDFVMSNSHYEALEDANYNLARVLRRVDANNPLTLRVAGGQQTLRGQYLYNGNDLVVDQDNVVDAAGVLTSRAFMAAHAVAGTNRRLVEFTLRQFTCRPIDKWADNTLADEMVGLDVDRNPVGDHNKYQTTCRGCHAQMDSFRPMFARLTFENNFVKHAWVMDQSAETDPNVMNEDPTVMIEVPIGVSGKMNRNFDTNNVPDPQSKFITGTAWINRMTQGLNAAYFGWDPTVPMEGTKIQEFGNMLANSQAFSGCMAKRAFRSVCKREAESFDEAELTAIAQEFKTTDNYNLKRLFERIAVTPACLGQ